MPGQDRRADGRNPGRGAEPVPAEHPGIRRKLHLPVRCDSHRADGGVDADSVNGDPHRSTLWRFLDRCGHGERAAHLASRTYGRVIHRIRETLQPLRSGWSQLLLPRR